MRCLYKLAVAVCIAFALPALAQDSGKLDPARIAAAKELMEATGMTKQMDQMVSVMAEGFRKGANSSGGGAAADKLSDEFEGHMQRLMSYRADMIKEFAVIYAERFTAEELKTVTEFYRSPTGQKFIQASPELMQAGAQIGIKYSQKAMQKPADKAP
jgi:hypothetical protein